MTRFAILPATLAALLWTANFSHAQTVAATVNGSVIIATGSTYQTVLAAVTGVTIARRSLTIQNNNITADNCWVFIGGGAATKPTSILLLPGGSYTRYYPYIPSDAIQATCATTGNSLYVDTQ
jgi:hypothetical protein